MIIKRFILLSVLFLSSFVCFIDASWSSRGLKDDELMRVLSFLPKRDLKRVLKVNDNAMRAYKFKHQFKIAAKIAQPMILRDIGCVKSVAVMQDGRVVSGSRFNRVHIWDQG